MKAENLSKRGSGEALLRNLDKHKERLKQAIAKLASRTGKSTGDVEAAMMRSVSGKAAPGDEYVKKFFMGGLDKGQTGRIV